MQVFISGTDTNIGKTVISSWLALHTGFAYFKPIQTGILDDRDAVTVSKLANVKIYPEMFCYKHPLSPHLAASLEGEEIDIQKIILPKEQNLIIEGAGGLLVPINKEYLMIDLIKQLRTSVILVASSKLGTINHTLLSLEALNKRDIKVLGVIINGPINHDNKKAIEYYGNTEVLAEIPSLDEVSSYNLGQVFLPDKLKQILVGKNEAF